MGAWCPLVCGKRYVLSSSNSLLQPGEPLCPTLPIFSGPPAPVLTLYTKPPTKSTKKNKRGQGEAGYVWLVVSITSEQMRFRANEEEKEGKKEGEHICEWGRKPLLSAASDQTSSLAALNGTSSFLLPSSSQKTFAWLKLFAEDTIFTHRQ